MPNQLMRASDPAARACGPMDREMATSASTAEATSLWSEGGESTGRCYRVWPARYHPRMVSAPVRPADLPNLEQQQRPVVTAEPASESVPALDLALRTVGDRWSLAIVAQLTAGPQRFNDLATSVTSIARTVLSDRLRRLEDAGIIARRQYSVSPVRWNYRLTVSGGELARVCGVLADWSSRHMGSGAAVLSHSECGAEVMPAYRCERCGLVHAREVTSTL